MRPFDNSFSRPEDLRQSTKRVKPAEKVNTSSAAFKRGVEAGLNSPEGTKNWQAGNELGQELKDKGEQKPPVTESLVKEPLIPLFLSTLGGNKGNAQDEKDEAVE